MAQPPVSQFSGIFVSYRRADSQSDAGRLFDDLEDHFGQGHIFMDVDNIEPGEDFFEVIENAVGSCEIVVAVMGQSWLSISDGTSRRLDNPKDLVRLEIATALKRDIRLIPVLVQGATMPSPQELPEDIQLFSRRNAIEISPKRWRYDVAKLIGVLEKVLAARKEARLAEVARQAEEESRRVEDEQKRRAEEESQRRLAEEQAKQRVAEDERRLKEESERKALEEKRRAEEEAQRRLAEEEERRAKEERLRKAQEMRRAEEDTKRRIAEEAAKRRAAEQRTQAFEEETRRATERRRAEEERQRRLAAEEAERESRVEEEKARAEKENTLVPQEVSRQDEHAELHQFEKRVHVIPPATSVTAHTDSKSNQSFSVFGSVELPTARADATRPKMLLATIAGVALLAIVGLIWLGQTSKGNQPSAASSAVPSNITVNASPSAVPPAATPSAEEVKKVTVRLMPMFKNVAGRTLVSPVLVTLVTSAGRLTKIRGVEGSNYLTFDNVPCDEQITVNIREQDYEANRKPIAYVTPGVTYKRYIYCSKPINNLGELKQNLDDF